MYTGNEWSAIPLLMEEWNGIKDKLEALYKIRDVKSTIPYMEKGIELFLQFLFWTNEQSVSLNQPIPVIGLAFKPVNVEERLAFIQSRPSLFQSYRQLCELMVEQEKIYIKQNIKRKAPRPNVNGFSSGGQKLKSH
jgi:hypothetical protein